jgi:hypothetical protein
MRNIAALLVFSTWIAIGLALGLALSKAIGF